MSNINVGNPNFTYYDVVIECGARTERERLMVSIYTS